MNFLLHLKIEYPIPLGLPSRVEKEVGGVICMGNTCKSMADSCQCMTKPLQYCKVISLQLIKINEKNRIHFCLKIILQLYL